MEFLLKPPGPRTMWMTKRGEILSSIQTTTGPEEYNSEGFNMYIERLYGEVERKMLLLPIGITRERSQTEGSITKVPRGSPKDKAMMSLICEFMRTRDDTWTPTTLGVNEEELLGVDEVG